MTAIASILDQKILVDQVGFHGRVRRPLRREVGFVDYVHGREVRHVGYVDRGLDDIAHAATTCFDNRP
jgi:hypothetical protein